MHHSIENGIWLCDNCARMIDVDENAYTVDILMKWKTDAENRQRDIIIKKNRDDQITSMDNNQLAIYRKTKKQINDLNTAIIYAYSYWKENFQRFNEIELEAELIDHYNLYIKDLEYISNIFQKSNSLYSLINENSLDLGCELAREIEKFVNYLNFSYDTDNCGLYNNYWKSFFYMIKNNYSKLQLSKKRIDEILFDFYSTNS